MFIFLTASEKIGIVFEIFTIHYNQGPADVDVVAALGDYLVAGAGALANTTIDSFKDFPQVSFAMGEEILYWFYQGFSHPFRWERRLEEIHNTSKHLETV